MSNVRFLDNVLVQAPSTTGDSVGAGFPRVVFLGETKTVVTNTNSYAFDVYNLGTINVKAGTSVEVGGGTVYSHGLLRIENEFTNQGIININGIFEIGESNTFASIAVI
tara:strand:+ start:491 stop:817 length:327 start_codon:yes stop_codon:yes gene_type:complete